MNTNQRCAPLFVFTCPLTSPYRGRISDVDGFLHGNILEVSKEIWGDVRAKAVSKSKQLEEKISQLINSKGAMKRQDELLQSILGVGPKV